MSTLGFYCIFVLLIGLVRTAIIMVYSFVNAIPLANYDVIYDVPTIVEEHFCRD